MSSRVLKSDYGRIEIMIYCGSLLNGIKVKIRLW